MKRAFLIILVASLYNPAESDVTATFLLSTPENSDPNKRQEFSIGNYGALIFDRTKIYKVICHGWTESENSVWYMDLIQAYTKRDKNVITVGYHKAVSNPTYIMAARNVKLVGKLIGETISDLSLSKNIPLDHFHLIGHSLGGHVVGVAGETIQKVTNSSVGRLTGLDPAWPAFESKRLSYNPTNRLSKGDAKFVDVIHTSKLGIYRSIGDVDVYPNGGQNQKGCQSQTRCNHPMSILILLLSIDEKLPKAAKCNGNGKYDSASCPNADTLVGEYVDLDVRGNYYLETGSEVAENCSWLWNGPNVDIKELQLVSYLFS